MEMANTKNRLLAASLSCFLALTGLACGDEEKPSSDDSPGGEREDASTPARNDSGTNSRDAGATTPRDAAGDGEDAGSTSARDAGSVRDAASSGDDTGNTIYTGSPACPGDQQNVAGTIDGKSVDSALDELSRGDNATYWELSRTFEGDVAQATLRWEPELDDGPSKAAVNEGTLELSSALGGGKYCVVEGEAQRGNDDDEDRMRFFYTVTKVKRAQGSSCTGDEIEADLKFCRVVY